jgi:hypothetical protein
VTTGFLGREFWWDKLERVVFSWAALPEQLSLRIRGGSYEWVAGETRRRPASGDRKDSAHSLHQSLLLLSPPEREKAMGQLCAWSGTAPDDQPSRRALTDGELIELAAGDLIEIGAHTVSHPVLAGLPTPVQRSEIQDSKAYLGNILGRSVSSFAYPNGSFSQQTQAIVQRSGFGCACASFKDVAWRGSDCFHLPRLWIPDCDGKAFSRWLRWWLPA